MPFPRTALFFQLDGSNEIDGPKALTFDQPVGTLPVVDDARWSAGVTDNSFIAIVVWAVLLIALQVVAWPIVRRIFTSFPDGGWAFARLTALLTGGFGVWFLASVDIIAFRAAWAGVALLVIGGLGLLAARRIPLNNDASPFWRNPIALAAELVFWSVFAVFLLYRLINPDSYHPIWGGEKPMEFAHLNAILRSAHFPPIDPWYSDGYINYYYYGTYLVAFLVKLTGIPAEIAFNLAQPTFPALLATASFSISAALGKRLTQSTAGAITGGLLGVFFIQFAGNLISAQRVIDRAINDVGNVNTFAYWVFDPSRAIPDASGNPANITEFPYFAALYADLHPHVIAMPFTVLIIALAWQVAFQWRLLPLVLVRRKLDFRDAFSLLAPLALAALGIGTLFMTNAWDMPMSFAITAMGVVMATQGIPGATVRLLVSALVIGGVGLTSWILILPFTTHYVALFREIGSVQDRTPLLAIQSHLGSQFLLMTLAVAAISASRVIRRRRALAVHAALSCALLAAFLVIQWLGNDGTPPWERIGEFGVVTIVVFIWVTAAWTETNHPADFGVNPVVLKTLLAQTVLLTVMLLALDRLVLGLYLGIGLSAVILWFAMGGSAERFIVGLIAGGMLLGASLELFYLVDDLSGSPWYRMNTIFKFYNQIWILFGISTAVLVGRSIWETVVAPSQPEQQQPGGNQPGRQISIWTWASAALVVPVTIASLAYAVVATPIRLDQDWGGRQNLTLNAYRWMEYGQTPLLPSGVINYKDDLAAINWFNNNVSGAPVIAEAAFGTYRCNGSRFSIATGLPAPVGWVRHESQQRFPDDLVARENALRELYTSPSTTQKEQIIDQYNIEYIIVGETERHYPTIDGNDCIDTGSAQGITLLEGMVGSSLEVAFRHGSTTVYRVSGN